MQLSKHWLFVCSLGLCLFSRVAVRSVQFYSIFTCHVCKQLHINSVSCNLSIEQETTSYFCIFVSINYSPTASEASCGAYQTFTGLWVLLKVAKVPSQDARSPSLMKIGGQISPTKMRLTTKNHILRRSARTEFFRWHFYFFLNHFI